MAAERKLHQWRIGWLDKDGKRVTHNIGVDSDEAMYRVACMLGKVTSTMDLKDFEAHKIENNKVSVYSSEMEKQVVPDLQKELEAKQTGQQMALVPLEDTRINVKPLELPEVLENTISSKFRKVVTIPINAA